MLVFIQILNIFYQSEDVYYMLYIAIITSFAANVYKSSGKYSHVFIDYVRKC